MTDTTITNTTSKFTEKIVTKCTNKSKKIGYLILLLLSTSLSMMPHESFAKSSSGQVKASKYSNLERAAQNYELAACSQMAIAEDAISNSMESLNSNYDHNILTDVLNMNIQAADLLIAAAGNYDKAANCWRRAANVIVSQDEKKYGERSKENANNAEKTATRLLERAVSIIEQVAISFSVDNKPLTQIHLSQKAAGLRERLAQRL